MAYSPCSVTPSIPEASVPNVINEPTKSFTEISFRVRQFDFRWLRVNLTAQKNINIPRYPLYSTDAKHINKMCDLFIMLLLMGNRYRNDLQKINRVERVVSMTLVEGSETNDRWMETGGLLGFLSRR